MDQREAASLQGGYRELQPQAELAGDLACLWYDTRSVETDEPRSQLVLPDGCIDVVWVRGQEPALAGPATLPLEADIPRGATVVGARFAPGRAPAYLGLPADALLNLNVPLRQIWHHDAERLLDQLEDTHTISDGVRALENALLRRKSQSPDDLVHSAVSQLERRPERSISVLSDGLGVSQRHLLRRFTAAVGYGPRVFGRVIRLRRFLTLLSRREHADHDLTRLAVEAGFADHSHLVHECAELAGMTPSALRLRWTG